MRVQIALRRLGNASPMITAGLYTGVAVLVILIDRFWSTNLALAVVAFAAGIVAYIGSQSPDVLDQRSGRTT